MKVPWDSYREFEVDDPFNGNVLKGALSTTSNNTYGALWITHVNGKECYQKIYATPKMHYPFDKGGNWRWPSDTLYVTVREKLDGTNVFAYKYKDAQGNVYVSYKTRLTPVIKNSKWGKFKDWWEEMLNKYPIEEEVLNSFCDGISFELYGSKNRHLIQYDEKLNAKVLFGRLDDDILEPSSIDVELPTAKLITKIDEPDDLTSVYHEVKRQLDEQIVEEDEYLRGMEGVIWYVVTKNDRIQYKEKPEAVLKEHWSHMDEKSIRVTCQNAYENNDDPTYDDIKELLLEEYSENDIQDNEDKIKRILSEVRDYVELKNNVLQDYENRNLDFNERFEETMRWYGKNYDKKDASKIYQILEDHYK